MIINELFMFTHVEFDTVVLHVFVSILIQWEMKKPERLYIALLFVQFFHSFAYSPSWWMTVGSTSDRISSTRSDETLFCTTYFFFAIFQLDSFPIRVHETRMYWRITKAYFHFLFKNRLKTLIRVSTFIMKMIN